MSRRTRIPLRELKVEQMASWDDAPRRGLLAFLAVLLFLLVGAFGLLPKYAVWQQELARAQSLQQQLTEAVRLTGHTRDLNAPTVNILKDTELSLWTAQLAHDAEKYKLQKVIIKPVKSASASKTMDSNNVQSDIGTAALEVGAEGSYSNLLKWWAYLSNQTSVLSISDIELDGLLKDKVRGQMRITVAYEGQS